MVQHSGGHYWKPISPLQGHFSTQVHRLTRSLPDFARLVDRFEAAGCSFVYVTQSFNTSSSMGRLTLNMLLSFAQFEREVTAERIRDKIAVSKKHGLWMGGVPPLGYDPHPDPNTRSLVISEVERGTVEALFELYDRLDCLRAVELEAGRRGLLSKRHVLSTGRVQGGGRLSRGQIHHILRNPIYLGRIRHKDKVWEGRHEAILDAEGIEITFRIGSDNALAGAQGAEYVVSELGADATGPALVIEGLAGNITGQKRASGFADKLAELAPGLEIVASLPGDWDRGKVANITNDILTWHCQVDHAGHVG